MTNISTRITDIGALEAACREMGLRFARNQKKARYWNGAQWDCDHAILLEGCAHEIAVKRDKNGWAIALDGEGGEGRKLTERIGLGGGKLIQSYGVHKTIFEAHRKGMQVSRQVMANGSVKLVLT